MIPVLVIEVAANLDDEDRHGVWFLRSGRSSLTERRKRTGEKAPAGRDDTRAGRAGSKRGVFTEGAKGTPNVVRKGERTRDAGRLTSVILKTLLFS